LEILVIFLAALSPLVQQDVRILKAITTSSYQRVTLVHACNCIMTAIEGLKLGHKGQLS
jgi:hypothetical protein